MTSPAGPNDLPPGPERPSNNDYRDLGITGRQSPPSRRLHSRALAVLLVAVALVAGIIAGMALERFVVLPHSMRGRRAIGGFGGPLGMRGALRQPTEEQRRMLRQRLTDELHLNPVQAHQVDSIMSVQELAFRALQQETQPRFRALIVETHSKIDSVLTPEQRAIHDSRPIGRQRFGTRP